MIHKIWANNKSFKAVEFKTGLNILLAERSKESGSKDTRNGAGKTTLLRIIHFCFGADLSRLNLPCNDIKEWVFSMKLDLLGEVFVINRAIDNSGKIEIEGLTEKLPITPSITEEGVKFYKNGTWKEILGKCFFFLKEDLVAKYKLSSRALISYFLRKGADAFIDPFKYFGQQRSYSMQMHNTFLLGLDWVLTSEAQELKDKAKANEALNKAVKEGIVSSLGELETQQIHSEEELEKETEAIKSFRVLPQYQKIQDESDKLTEDLHQISNETLLVKRKLEMYNKSIDDDTPPDDNSVLRLFSEAGLNFPSNVKKTLDQVKAFHKNIIENREHFLKAEISQLENRLNTLNESLKLKSEKRADLLMLLETHGALEEFNLLQRLLLEKESKLNDVKRKISDIKNSKTIKKNIKAKKIELETKLQLDYELKKEERKKAVKLFNENSLALYGESGDLIINHSENGYSFDVEIQKSGSEGVGKMKIYCYDLMLVELMTELNGINFLFHDSSIYDGVDSRQRALALMQAHKKGKTMGFQYICSLNSDMVPYNDFDDDFIFDDYVRLILKDKDPKNTLLGFHFEVEKKKSQRT